MDFMFVGAEGTFVDEPRAKATVLMVTCKDDGFAWMMATCRARQKCVRRQRSTAWRWCFDSGVRTKLLRSRRMGSPALSRSLGEYKPDVTRQRLWHRQSVGGHLRDWSSGTCELNGTGSVAGVLPGRARTHGCESRHGHTAVPMDVAASSADGGALPVRPENETDPAQERTRGCWYEAALVPLGEVVMAKIADADKIESRQAGQCLGQSGLGRPCG